MPVEDRGGSGRERSADVFPWLVTLGALCFGLVVYLHSTQGALAEREALRAQEHALRARLEALRAESAATAAHRERLADDPETILVELDRLGIPPEEAGERAAK